MFEQGLPQDDFESPPLEALQTIPEMCSCLLSVESRLGLRKKRQGYLRFAKEVGKEKNRSKTMCPNSKDEHKNHHQHTNSNLDE